MLRKLFTIGIFTYCLFLSSALFAEDKIKDTIIVSAPPQVYFIKQIAKENFIVKSMMESTSTLTTYNPTAKHYMATETAIAYLKINMYNEKDWISKIKILNKDIKTFDTTINIDKYIIENNIYSWLDPMLVRIQAKNILNILIELDEENTEFYKKNYRTFVNSITSLDYQIKSIFKHKREHVFMTFQPVWGYFAKRYKIKQLEINVDFQSEKEGVAKKILNIAIKNSTKVLFIPTYYFPKRLFNEINEKARVSIIPISYLEYDWYNNLLNVARVISYTPTMY